LTFEYVFYIILTFEYVFYIILTFEYVHCTQTLEYVHRYGLYTITARGLLRIFANFCKATMELDILTLN
jgi:hypothetical protein